MAKLNDTLVCENFKLEDFVFNPLTGSAANTDYTVDMTDCKEEVQLIVDASDSAANVSLDLEAGGYPTKSRAKSYVIPPRSCKYISLSGGEVMQSDGMAHFRVSGLTDSSTLRVAVLKRRFVTNH